MRVRLFHTLIMGGQIRLQVSRSQRAWYNIPVEQGAKMATTKIPRPKLTGRIDDRNTIVKVDPSVAKKKKPKK